MSQMTSAFSFYRTNKKKNVKNKSSIGSKSVAKKTTTKAAKNIPKGNLNKSTQKAKQNGVKKDLNGNSKLQNKKSCKSDEYSKSSDSESTDSSSYDSDSSEECSCDSENSNCDTSPSSTYANEYTLNSYSDDSESESEHDDEVFSLDKLKTKSGNKRQNNNSENNIVAKQPKITNKTNNTTNTKTKTSKGQQAIKTANSRKSLPAKTTITNVASAKSNARRSLSSVTTSQCPTNPQTNIITTKVKTEALSSSLNINKSNSIEEGLRVFGLILNPLDANEFLTKYWEQNVCLIKREKPDYYSHLISFQMIDKMLLDHNVEFTKNIDITSYEKGVRKTLNPDGRALPPVVWDYYGQGCSIRILNPQTFLQSIFAMNATLQEYFHCMVGANVYLTPPNSQGFAPHYDDIEAFVLQIEGRKRWRLYKPRNQSEVLPRYSSKNFNQNEIGKPILDHVLNQGDVLYFPRGTIHQASTEPGYHSLHITISVYQKQSYGDLLEYLMPRILKSAIINNVEFRKGLPLDTWRQGGIAFNNNDTRERANLMEQISTLLKKALETHRMPELVDNAVDEMAKRFQHEALPPHLNPSERMHTIYGSRSVLNEKGDCVCDYQFDVRTNVRLLRANILRLVREDGNKICIYFYAHNSKEFKEFEPNLIEITPEDASCVEVLLRSYPAYIGVSQLPLSDDSRKIEFAQALWERGLLMLEKPLK